MYPDLLRIGNFTLHTYGFCIALGALLGILFVSREAKREGLNRQLLLDLVFYLLIAAILGSRIFYIILNPGYYLKHPLESLMIWRGGLVFYGGFLFAFPTCYLYLKKHGGTLSIFELRRLTKSGFIIAFKLNNASFLAELMISSGLDE